MLLDSAVLTHTGATSVNGGTLRLAGSNNRLPATTSVTVNTGGTLDVNSLEQTVTGLSGQGSVTLGTGKLTVNSTADTTFSGSLSGNGASLVKTGSNKLSLSGVSSYTGTTTVNGGTLEGNTLSLPTAVTLSNNSSVAFNQTATGDFSKLITGDGGLIKSGAGVLSLSTAASYTGGTSINGGTLQLVGVSNTPVSGSMLWLDASKLSLADGAAVTSLSDLSGHNNTAVASSATAPTFNASGANNLGTIHFQGEGQGLVTSNTLGISGNASRTIFAVMQKNDTTTPDNGRMLVVTGIPEGASGEDGPKGFGIDAHAVSDSDSENVHAVHRGVRWSYITESTRQDL